VPIIILLLLAALVATFGFWHALQAIIGAVGVIVVLCLLGVALIAGIVAWLFGRRQLSSACLLGGSGQV